jgi:hypothetical protein
MDSVLIGLLRDLWSESHRHYPALREVLSHGYAAPKGFKVSETEWPGLQRDILFVGINPSYNESHSVKADLSSLSDGDLPAFPEVVYDTFDIPIEEESVRYFRDLKALIQSARLPDKSYTYLDLFAFRMTDQKQIRAMIGTPGWVEFLCGQLSITDWYIRHIVRPRMIVVVNAEACDYLGLNADWNAVPPRNVWMGYKRSPQLDEVTGMYIITSIHSGLSEESEQEPLAKPIYVLPELMKDHDLENELFSRLAVLVEEMK